MFILTSSACFGSEGDEQANSFAYLYSSLCLMNLASLDDLREKLKPVPKLPVEKAAFFLADEPGDAWPFPDGHGTFVLALLGGKSFCAVYARRANTETVIKLFTALVAQPPAPFTVKQLMNKQAHTAASWTTHTDSYEWSHSKCGQKNVVYSQDCPTRAPPTSSAWFGGDRRTMKI